MKAAIAINPNFFILYYILNNAYFQALFTKLCIFFCIKITIYNKFIYYPYKNRDVLTVPNPYIKLKEDFDNIVRLAGIDANFFQLITLINNDVLINVEKNKQNN